MADRYYSVEEVQEAKAARGSHEYAARRFLFAGKHLAKSIRKCLPRMRKASARIKRYLERAS